MNKPNKTARVVTPGEVKSQMEHDSRVLNKRYELEAAYRKALGEKLFDIVVIEAKPVIPSEAETIRSMYLRVRDEGYFAEMAEAMVCAEEAKDRLKAIIKNHVNELNA